MQRAIIMASLLVPACSGQDLDDGEPAPECTATIEAVGTRARSILIGEREDLSVVVRDACIGLVARAAVSFSILDSTSDARLQLSEAASDDLGVAATSLEAGATAGVVVIVARHAMSEVRFTVTIADACAGHCTNGSEDCGEAGLDCGGACAACVPDPPIDDAVVQAHSLPSEMVCEATPSPTVTTKNSGNTTWDHEVALEYVSPHPFLDPQASPRVSLDRDVPPGESATFLVPLLAPSDPGTYEARFQMARGPLAFGEVAAQSIAVTPGCAPPSCAFPQGVDDAGYIGTAASYADTDPAVDSAVNAAMVELTGCGVSTSCPITLPGSSAEEVCQVWFARVTERLREAGLCAGQHEVGSTDEIAVGNTGCAGRWYGYHVCNYGGPSVVWNPGARRGWWQIAPEWCSAN